MKQIAASSPIVALLRPYNFGLIGFQAILLWLQQNRKHRVVYILSYLHHFDTVVRQNDKSGRVPGTQTLGNAHIKKEFLTSV